MNENNIFYPDKDIIDVWINFLKSENNILKTKLPITDENWYLQVIDTIERIKMPYTVGIHMKTGHLLYYLDKNHNFLDGNKRTTIVIVYLFYFVNNYSVISQNRLLVLVKDVAKSHGARQKDYWMAKIEKELSYIVKSNEKIINKN